MLSRVVAVAGDHRLGNDAVGHVAQAHRLAGGAAQRFDALEQRAFGVELGRASRGRVRPRSRGAHDHSGIAASMQVTSMPSIDVDALAGGKDASR